MAVLEIRKQGKLLRTSEVPDERAAHGITVRLKGDQRVRVALGSSVVSGEFTVTLRAGGPDALGDRAVASVLAESDLPTEATSTEPGHGVSSAPTAALGDRSDGPMGSIDAPDGYTILGPLGHGGMGSVWRAMQAATQREVALKFMSSRLAMSKRARARFDREVRLTARLEHPGIARIYDSGHHRGASYYAMQLIEGERLDLFARHHGLDHTASAALVCQVCDAMAFAHAHGVVHRDLKPTNIIVEPGGHPVIVDFGLARMFEPEAGSLAVTEEGEAAGTPAFMSPEQAAGRLSEIDRRTDVFAIGCILYRLVTGRSPHDMSGPTHEVMRRIVEEEIRPPQLFASIAPDLRAIIMCACARDRSARYASAKEIGEDLRRFLSGSAVLAREYGVAERIRRGLRRNRSRVVIGACILSLIVLSVGAVAWFAHGAREARRVAEAEVAQIRFEKAALEDRLASMESEAKKLRRLVRDAAGASVQSADLARARARLADLESQIRGMSDQIATLSARLPAEPVARAASTLESTPAPTAVSSEASKPVPAPEQASAGPNAYEGYRRVHASFGGAFASAAVSGRISDVELVGRGAEIDELVRITSIERCDFGVDWSDGPLTVLPHIQIMNALGRVLVLESERRARVSDMDGAAATEVAALRMAVHSLGCARTFVEAAGATRLIESVCERIVARAPAGSIGARAGVAEALERTSESVAAEFPGAFARENQIMVAWLRSPPLRSNYPPPLSEWASVDQSDRDAAALELESLTTEIVAAWASQDPRAAVEAVYRRSASSPASGLLPVWRVYNDHQARAAARLDAASASLR